MKNFKMKSNEGERKKKIKNNKKRKYKKIK